MVATVMITPGAPIATCEDVSRVYRVGGEDVYAVREVSCENELGFPLPQSLMSSTMDPALSPQKRVFESKKRLLSLATTPTNWRAAFDCSKARRLG